MGALVWKNGKKYEGMWKSNKHDGKGVLTYTINDPRKRKLYDGEWKVCKQRGCIMKKRV